ncbi:metaxin 1 [Thoreauomyces humboldtii]|nr:metaxin 1 [Thoreauomyces humboldtii]
MSSPTTPTVQTSLASSAPPPTLELFTWGPAYDLPSFDPFCLSAITYLQFTGARWVVNECNDPEISPRGELPMLRDSLLEPVVGSGKIISYLRKKGHDLDAQLDSKQKAAVLAYTTLFETKLYDALLHSWYISSNLATSTRPTLAGSLRGWKGFRVPTQLQKKAEARVKGYRRTIYKGKECNEIYVLAREWYTVLANRLRDQEYFFGDSPTSLDAVAYSHLALHAVPTLATPHLFTILTFEFPTLHAYVLRIRERWFSEPILKAPTPSRALVATLLNAPREFVRRAFGAHPAVVKEKTREERRKDFTNIASLVGGIAFFVGFVWYNAIVRIDFGEDDGEFEEAEGEESTVIWKSGEVHNRSA